MGIPVYEPWLTNIEERYLLDAYRSSWISSTGKYLDKSEELLAEILRAERVHLTSSGTTALHLALRAVGVKAGDKVIVPATTFVASAFAASYCGAEILFVDSAQSSWNMDLVLVEKLCQEHDIKAVIAVHLYGVPVDMYRLRELKTKYGFAIVEDACESLGSSIGSIPTGTFGDVGVFSFYGNKTITSGEGGCIVTNSTEIADKALLLRGQAQDPNKRYWHLDIGHNYRMTNLQAAVLYGQLERYHEIQNTKARILNRYKKNLEKHVIFQKLKDGFYNAGWVVSIFTNVKTKKMMKHLKKHGVDSRPVFYPICKMPPYESKIKVPVSSQLAKYGITLPSSPTLAEKEIDYICDLILEKVND